MKSGEVLQDSYKERISKASSDRRSRVILALDLEGSAPDRLLAQGTMLLNLTVDSLCAVKLGRQTVLSLGTQRTRQLVGLAKTNAIPAIVDEKLNDIGETNKSILREYYKIGFDGITANPFTGWKEGLQPVFELAHRQRMGILLLTYMSHRGASEGYGQMVLTKVSRTPRFQYELFARKAVLWKADGAVVGATRPGKIREVKSILGMRVPIYSPGVGAQGGQVKSALEAGTDYFIIGRSIARASNPNAAAAAYARESFNGTV